MIQLRKVILIGAGNIGSRHLQGLAKVKQSLDITIVDPFLQSLDLAKQRFEQIPGFQKHKVRFLEKLEGSYFDAAIIATNSNTRRKVTEELLKKAEVKNIIFEKLLFQQKEDYDFISKLLKRDNIPAWVNCSMRVTPFYRNLKKKFENKKIIYLLTGTKFGIATQAIHFIDHMVFLTDSFDFEIDTSSLDREILDSKRKGFLELTGTLKINFANGSVGIFADFKDGDAPIIAEIYSDRARAIANETTRETFISESKKWLIKPAKEALLFQSDMTNKVLEDILARGISELPTYEESKIIHLKLLESLLKFLNKYSSKKYKYYPFT